jgi:lysyl oxidase
MSEPMSPRRGRERARNARRWLLAVLAAAAVAATFGSTGPAVAGSQPPLRPDLETLPPTDFALDDNGGKRVLLRFENTVHDVGEGPVELRPKRNDCDGDGRFRDDRTAIQRVFRDSDGDGIFTRGVDTSLTTHVAGCFRFHRVHNHWHFTKFARYELFPLSGGPLVSAHSKVGFCLIDTTRTMPGLPGSPATRNYGSCQPGAIQGISVGWGDVYSSSLPGQWVDVTDVPDGDYCLVSTVDPANRLVESDDSDNAGSQGVRIQGGAASSLRGAC